MRFLHTADLHLDSAFCKVGALDADAQRKKQRELLERIFNLAQAQSCDMILIAGDLFDTPVATPESAALALRLFAEWKKPIFIAPGNHDALVAGGFYKSAALPENVYLFTSEELQYFDIEFDETVLMQNGVSEDRITVNTKMDATDNVETSRSAILTLSVE